MKNVRFRLTAICLALTMALSLVGCAKQPANETGDKTSGEKTITITDMAGYEVNIPADTKNNTVATTYGVITPFYVTLNMSDRVLATTIKNKGFMRKADDKIMNAGDIGNRTLDNEALAAYAPDILMLRVTDTDKKAIGDRLGIPTVMLYIETAEEVIETYQILGKIFGCEERSEELIAYINNEMSEIDKLSKTIPDSEKKTAVCMGSLLGQVAGENMLQSMMIEHAGGKSEVTEVSDDKMWVDVGVEKVFDYNPDYIFVSSSNPLDYKIDKLYEESAWSGMNAVKNKTIYLIPAKLDSWDMPGPAFILGIYYMMHCMYPELMPTEKLQEKIDAFYTLFYGKTFTGEDIGYSF